jgi:type IV secretion system protein VirB3
MAQGSSSVQADPLFVGLTRPSLPLGVSTMWLAFNGASTMIGLVLDSSFKYIIIGACVHMIGYFLYSKEPLFLELISTKYSKCSPRTNSILVHGKNSYDPF